MFNPFWGLDPYGSGLCCRHFEVHAASLFMIETRVVFIGNSGRAEGGLGCSKPPPHSEILTFDKAEPNSQFSGKYIRNNLIRILVSLICKFSGNSN
jgi:hypothetical protein